MSWHINVRLHKHPIRCYINHIVPLFPVFCIGIVAVPTSNGIKAV